MVWEHMNKTYYLFHWCLFYFYSFADSILVSSPWDNYLYGILYRLIWCIKCFIQLSNAFKNEISASKSCGLWFRHIGACGFGWEFSVEILAIIWVRWHYRGRSNDTPLCHINLRGIIGVYNQWFYVRIYAYRKLNEKERKRKSER